MSVEVPFATRFAPNGMVCSVDHLASAAGVAALRDGGSASDAAIAANAVLAVTAQHMCGLGGDLFALVHTGGRAAPEVLNASGRAGSLADPDRLRAEGHTEMPFRGDIRSVTVPGCVDGWMALHERHGRLPLDRLLAPAIGYATDGFPASPLLAAVVPDIAHLEGAGDYTAGGAVRTGQLIRRPGVARTLEAVAREGRTGFYGGELGEGLLALGPDEYTAADLERSNADWVEPIAAEAWGHRLWTVPPNSQGYLTLASAWIADGLPVPDDEDDPCWAHLLVEAARQAGYDRNEVLHEHADGAALVAPDRLASRRAAVSADRTSALGAPAAAGDTMFLCAADADGTAVSLIQSNASGFGSHVIVPGPRIFLHNRGIGFSLEPGHPAEYGSGRRPRHTLSPAMITATDGTLVGPVGTMGGDGQPQILLQVLARLLHGGRSPAHAVGAGRWVLATEGPSGFDTWVDPDRLVVDVEGHAPDWDGGLVERGHRVRRTDPHLAHYGHAHLIVDRGGVWAGAADPRTRIGSVAGY